ncbi:bifunctional 2-polyprenyl-6-hydroxyphenol methylase/3-demethylubiquinol 3-O-methyltransferase UbiG [Nocardiopsis sp. JB363]|uniref:class I SAM-dependent methyltransferase n=1 Tax=Nocardiopsis sp. JB363 TaxID=1434837 RepID=UPI00097A861F|nr:class I SAM-dependent methyltransferase [Nocardiopsis sp. JB363]SIO88481.1 putative methyltransferase [Nocardiopsis sp. JB363]
MEPTTSEPRIGDAFGRTLQRCWAAGMAPGAAFEITERDDGYISTADALRYFTPLDDLSDLDQTAVALARGRILDVGTGAGRHALALQQQGKDVVGLDPSPGAVEVACQRGVAAELGSIAHPPEGIGTFDTLLLLGNNLGLLQGAQAAPGVLRQLASLARPGALLIGTGMDPAGSDPDHAAYQDRNRIRGRMPGQIRMRVRGGAVATEWFDYLLLNPHELDRLIQPSPWRWETIHEQGPKYLAVLHLNPS